MRPRYSIVVPIYNEIETLPELERRFVALFERLDGEVEVILVDDGSSDDSFAVMAAIAERDGRFRVI